jgi:hypothetical protein
MYRALGVNLVTTLSNILNIIGEDFGVDRIDPLFIHPNHLLSIVA